MDGLQEWQAAGADEPSGESGAMELELLPAPLRPLAAQLTALPPEIDRLDLQAAESVAGQYFRREPPEGDTALSVWWDARMRVLGLIACCPSLGIVNVACCGISRESEVERLCEGLRLNTVLRQLTVDGNDGFGSDFGCRQLSRILGSSPTLEMLCMDGVGLRPTGLSLLVGALVANPEPRLQVLNLENNQEIGDEGSCELLAQLLSNARTSKWLKKLRLLDIGLTAAGAARLAVGLTQSEALHTLQVGPCEAAELEAEEGPLKTVLSSVRCSKLVLTCSDEKGLAEGIGDLLRTNTSLTYLELDGGKFSTQEWRCIFSSLASSSTTTFVMENSGASLDHNSIDDLELLVAANPGLFIPDIVGSTLKGGSEWGFYCSCPSCVAASREIGAIDLEQLPQALRALVHELTAVPPTISSVDLGPWSEAGDYFRKPAGAMWWQVRMWVLGLIATCPSLTVVKLGDCRIHRESEVQRLCEGLKSNTVLRQLKVDENVGFGSEFGSRQLSEILASSSTLETLCMGGVGLRSTGLSQLVGALVANPESRLQVLDLDNNQEMGDGSSGELLAQLLSNPRTGKWLNELKIRDIGLKVTGAAGLSVGLAQSVSLETLRVGPGEAAQGEEGPLKILLSSVRCHQLDLTCSDEKGLAEDLAQYLLRNTSTGLILVNGQFSTQGWRCIFKALTTSSVIGFVMRDCATLDHNSVDDLEQLVVANPGLNITEITGSSLKAGSERGKFYCCCPSCIVPSDGGATLDAPTVSSLKLERLMNELSAIRPSIKCIRSEDLDYIEARPDLRLRLLELIGTCPSLTSITFPSYIISGDDREGVNALCAGLASNPVLEELILEGNYGFGTDYGCAQLAKVVSGCARTLRQLDLCAMNMRTTGLQHLTQALQNNGGRDIMPVFRSLKLSDNAELGDGGAMLIADLLRSSTIFYHLSIQYIGMGKRGAQALSLALQCNASITDFMVGEMAGKETMDIVLMGLIHHPTLKRLVLCRGWRTEGLAKLLESNATLLRLQLERFLFPPEEWKIIFKALRNNKVLRVLDLRGVGVDLDPVFHDLLELLEINTTLEKIYLHGTDLTRNGKVTLVEEALRRNKQQATYLALLKAKLPLVQPSTGRLFLCGSPFAGKSTLRESMVRFYHKHNVQQALGCIGAARAQMLARSGIRARTKGIEIQVLREDKEMQITIWDMAGQEQYHAMHDHLFPTTNQACMFIFVYNPMHMKSSEHGLLDDNEDKKRFREDLLFWIRFIASNLRSTGHRRPMVSIVISHLDKLLPTHDVQRVVSWAETVVADLRSEFGEVVDVHKDVHAVKTFSASSVEPVVQLVFDHFQQLLQQLPPVIGACTKMSHALARRTLQPNTQPMVRANEFFEICAREVEDLGTLLLQEDHASQANSGALQAYVMEAKQAVASYLHDVGSIVYFQDLDLIVVNPNWLGNIFLSKFIKVGMGLQRDGMLPTRHNGLIEEIEFKPLLENFLRNSKPACLGFTADDLLQLLLKLELCCIDDTSSTRVRYLVPSSLSDGREEALLQTTSSSNMCFSCFTGTRGPQFNNYEVIQRGVLEWPIDTRDSAECTYFGKRLECADAKRTLFTPGLFPRLQVYLRGVLEKSHCLITRSEQYKNEYNLIRICMNGYEIFVESNGDTFIDVLVRSDKPRDETSDFVQQTIITEIQAFCATRGCPGVALIECIVRPECVRYLPCCLDRKDQAVPVETLKQELAKGILSNTKFVNTYAAIENEGGAVIDTLRMGLSYQYYWPRVPNSNIGEGFTKAVDLLDTQSLMEILDREKSTLSRVANQICEATKEVGHVQESMEVDDGIGDHLMATYYDEDMHNRTHVEQIHMRFDKLEAMLAEQKDLLLKKIFPNLKELKMQQQQMQDALKSGVDEVQSFMRDLQNTKIPRFPYFTDTDVGTSEKFTAFFRVESALKLHFMCEDPSGMHFVPNQEGCDVRIQQPEYETLRSIALSSAKVLYILMKAGLQIGAGIGGIVPDFTSAAGDVLPLASTALGNMLNDIKLNDQYSAASQEAMAYLQKILRGKSITTVFKLRRVEYLHYNVAKNLQRVSARFGWVCDQCRKRGLDSRSLKDCLE